MGVIILISADVTLLRSLPISISEILRRWHFALPPTNLWLAILISASCPCVSSVEITVCWGGVGGAKVLKSLFSGGGGVLRGSQVQNSGFFSEKGLSNWGFS